MTKPTLIACEWNDAHGSSTMFSVEEAEHKPYKFTSVGFLIKSDSVGVSLASEIGEDGRFRDHTFIPRAMVVSEVSLGSLKKPRKPKVLPVPPTS